MRISVISLTEKGRVISQKLSQKLSDRLPEKMAHSHIISRYAFYKHSDKGAQEFENLGELVGRLFSENEAMIFICACGIAVRAIAPLVKDKTSDPAVVVADDMGKFAISLLSGHLGGANRLAKITAEAIGAQAVITTSTDVGGVFSPDSFARANNLIISDMEAAKSVAAAATHGEKLALYSDFPIINKPAEFFDYAQIGVCVSAVEKKPFPTTLNLIPRNIVIGVGCKRGTDFNTIREFVDKTLDKASIDIRRVCAVASIDLKKDERGLMEFCKSLGVELVTFSAEELRGARGEFTASEFVNVAVGVDNVCERSAVLAGGELILRKQAGSGVTVAAAELPFIADFKKEIF